MRFDVLLMNFFLDLDIVDGKTNKPVVIYGWKNEQFQAGRLEF